MKSHMFFVSVVLSLVLGLSACIHTSGEMQCHVKNNRQSDVIAAYSYQSIIDNVDKSNEFIIGATEQKQLPIPMHDVRGFMFFNTLDILTPEGDTIIHDAHLKQELWETETERVPQSSPYHIYDVERFILVVE